MTENPYCFAGQDEICSPQLIYYPEIIAQNIDLMKKLAGGADRLWPHVKTYKMEKVVKMLLAAGIKRFKCATIAELEMTVRAGAEAALMAYPLIGPNMERFLHICRDYPEVSLYAMGDDLEQVERLGSLAWKNHMTVRLLMDVDMGQHRTGVALEKAAALYRKWNAFEGIRMCGFHCYDGHRHEHGLEERMAAAAPWDAQINALQKELTAQGMDCGVTIMGGTPSFPCHEHLTDAYLSPGTCVIQDIGYRDAYADLPFVPAAALLTRVISRPSEDTFTLDLGTKAVACDPPIPRAQIVGMEYAQTVMHNEEHWVLKVPKEHRKDIPEIGSVLFALPVHICPTTALYASVLAVEGGRIREWWEVTAAKRRITY